MANYPIITTQRTMPGTSGGVRGRISFDVGQEELWQQVGRLAGVVGDISLKLHVQQAEIQLQESTLQAEEEMLNLSNRLRANQDEDTYNAELNKSIQTLNTFRPKNPLAARDYDSWVRRQTPGWKKDVNKAKEIRLNNKWRAMRDTLAEQSIETGDSTKLKLHMVAGVALGRTDEAAAGQFIRKTENAAEYNMGLNWALTNPEGLLDAIEVKDGKTQIEGLSTLTSGQVIALRSNAEGTINFNRRQEDTVTSAIYNDVLGHAAKGTPPQQMAELLKDTAGLSEVERTDLMNTYLLAYRTWQGTGSNPWTTTHDYNALMEMQLRISRGEPITEMDIWRKMLSKPDQGPTYSLNDARNLINQLPDNKDNVLKTPFADEWLAHVDEMYLKDKKIPQEDIAEWSQTRQGVEMIIRANYPNVGKAQKEIEEFLNPAKQKKAKGLLRRLWTAGAPVPLLGEVTGLGLKAASPLFMAGKVGLGLLEKPPVHVDSLEEAERLSQGTKFEYEGTVYTRR